MFDVAGRVVTLSLLVATALSGIASLAAARQLSAQPHSVQPDVAPHYRPQDLKRVLERHRHSTTADCFACHAAPKPAPNDLGLPRVFEHHRKAKAVRCSACHVETRLGDGEK